MIVSRPLASRVLYRSSPLAPHRTGTAIEITRARAGWQFVYFAVRQIAPGKAWTSDTGRQECCLVLLGGHCHVAFDGRSHTLGPRRSVFAGYPHAIYLPPRTRFRVEAEQLTELADGRAPAFANASAFAKATADRTAGKARRTKLEARIIRPEDCGFEIRGGGNATRQIVDIMPPGFPADRLMVCEVYTPAGNWSSYPPHKHDVDRPPGEVKLEEIYYYRFEHPDAYGIQRLYDFHPGLHPNAHSPRVGGPGRRADRAETVRHGDVMVIRAGYHPFVTAYGYNAYYLNVLAGTRRSMAASDDPRYAALRSWPAPDARVPIVAPPRR
ncbi:MAG TPA: 5-deoxy-glucuronate isomerase [Vicinamibacterales bacterium]